MGSSRRVAGVETLGFGGVSLGSIGEKVLMMWGSFQGRRFI
jgi:hypothetical protein